MISKAEKALGICLRKHQNTNLEFIKKLLLKLMEVTEMTMSTQALYETLVCLEKDDKLNG